ncbi:MAG: hypothetical protein QM504_18305 [Pseudomonadota bacterium]
MFKPNCILIFLLLLTISFSVCASYDYAVITTQKKAENIVQQLEPLFSKQAQFSAKGYQLIIKASPAVIKEIKYLLKQIDRPLKNLLIHIANKKTLNQLLKLTQTSEQLMTEAGSKNTVQTIQKSDGGTVKITSTQRNSDKRGDGIFQARVVEGSWVTISTGKDIPYYSTAYYRTPQTQFKKISSGFEARAILKPNNQVVVYIRAQNNHQNKNYSDMINTSSTETTLSGNLNQWLNFGQITQTHKKQQQQYEVQRLGGGIQYSNRTNQSEEHFYIRVNIIQ